MTPAEDFDEIYSSHAAAVYHSCLRAVSQPHTAESLTSEVFASLHIHSSDIERDDVRSWLAAQARRVAREYWQLESAARHLSDPVPDRNVSADPQMSLDRLIEQGSALKQVHRVCLILRFRHELSRPAMASLTGMSELQVKGHLQQAMRLLAKDRDMPEDADLEAELEAHGQAGLCPSPDLLFAAGEDVLPRAMGVTVSEHASRCALCQTLLEGLAPAAAELTPGQDARIHEQIMMALRPEEFPAESGDGEHPIWRMMGPIVVIVILAVGSVTSYRLIHRSAPAVTPQPVAPAAVRQNAPELDTLAPLAVPQVIGEASHALEAAQEPPTRELESALKFYGQGNFAAAAAAFVPIAARYPKADIPLLYLGVSQLELGNNTQAETTLAQAARQASASRESEAIWYLAVAELRNGKATSAAQRFQMLCLANGAHAARACALATQLSGAPR